MRRWLGIVGLAALAVAGVTAAEDKPQAEAKPEKAAPKPQMYEEAPEPDAPPDLLPNPDGVARMMRLEGWVVADHCGSDNNTPEARERVVACFERGEDLLFQTTGGDLYKIVKPEAVLDKIGKRWIVLGAVLNDELQVGSMIDPENRASGQGVLRPMSAPLSSGQELKPGAKPGRAGAPRAPASPPPASARPNEAPAAAPAAPPAPEATPAPAPAPAPDSQSDDDGD